MTDDKFYEWLKKRKTVILKIDDLSIRGPLMEIHNEYVEQYICLIKKA